MQNLFGQLKQIHFYSSFEDLLGIELKEQKNMVPKIIHRLRLL